METKPEQAPEIISEPDHIPVSTVRTPDETLSEFRPLVEQHFRTCLTVWSDYHRERLTDFRNRLQTCVTDLSQTDALYRIWQVADAYFQDLQTWVEASESEGEGSEPDGIAHWSDVTDTWLETLPEQASIPVTPQDWDDGPGDTAGIWIWKRGKRLGRIFSGASRSRVFPLHALIRMYLVLPYREFLQKEWAYHQEQILRHFSELHHIPHDLGLECLFLEHTEAVWQHDDVDYVSSRCDAWASHPEKIDTILEQIAEYRRIAEERFEQWFDKVSQEYLRQAGFAGTFILPVSAFASGEYEKQLRHATTHFEQLGQTWHTLIESEQDDWTHEIVLKRIQLQAGVAYFDLIQRVDEVLTQQILPAFSSSQQPLTDALQTIQDIDPAESSGINQTIKKIKRELVRELRRHVLPRMTDALLQADLDQIMADLEARLEEPIRALQPTHRIVHRRHSDRFPPVLEVEDVPVKSLLEDRDLSRVRNTLQEVRSEVQQNINTMIQGLSELDQVVEFNLNAAQTLLSEKQNPEEALQTVTEGLQRAQNQVEQSHQQCEHIKEVITQQTFNLTHTYLSEVQKLLDNDEVLELKLQLAQAQAQDRYRHYRSLIWTGIRRAVPWILSSAASLGRRIYGHYRRMHHMAGLDVVPSTDLQQFLTETQQRLDELPYVYQRIFHTDTGTDRRFLAARDEQLTLLKEDFERWQQGYYMTTVIVGERGCGRTTLLQFAEKDIYKRHSVRRINVKHTVYRPEEFISYMKEVFPECTFESLDELEAELLNLESPCVCIIETIQNLFIKTVDGFDLLERFLLLVSRTHRQVFWVVTCTLYSWEYLQKIIRIGQNFQRNMLLDRLTQSEMETIIMKRHRVTGYKAVYEIPDSIRKLRRFNKLRDPNEQQEYLRNVCFEHLQRIAMGNISVGMLFWLRGITRVEDNTLHINPLIDFDESALTLLSSEEMFTLGTILHHETLTADDHARVFHQTPEDSLTQLNLLCNKGIMIDTDGTYRIHPFLYRPVVQALKRMNILH